MISDDVFQRSRYTEYSAANVGSSHGRYWRTAYGTVPTADAAGLSAEPGIAAGTCEELESSCAREIRSS